MTEADVRFFKEPKKEPEKKAKTYPLSKVPEHMRDEFIKKAKEANMPVEEYLYKCWINKKG